MSEVKVRNKVSVPEPAAIILIISWQVESAQ